MTPHLRISLRIPCLLSDRALTPQCGLCWCVLACPLPPHIPLSTPLCLLPDFQVPGTSWHSQTCYLCTTVLLNMPLLPPGMNGLTDWKLSSICHSPCEQSSVPSLVIPFDLIQIAGLDSGWRLFADPGCQLAPPGPLSSVEIGWSPYFMPEVHPNLSQVLCLCPRALHTQGHLGPGFSAFRVEIHG